MKNTVLLMLFVMALGSVSAQLKDVTFEYQYDMKVETNQNENVEFSYLLDNDEAYIGLKTTEKGMDVINLFVPNSESVYSLMNFNGQKMAMETQMNRQSFLKETEDFSNPKVSDLPSKQIAGFTAEGKRIETPNFTYEIYYSKDTGYPFFNVFEINSTQSLYDKIQEKFQFLEDSVLLEATIIDKTSNQNKSKLVCTGFHEINETVAASTYKVQSAFNKK